jgi:hypothetical protein
MRLVQFTTKQGERRVGAVSEDRSGALEIVSDTASIYELARSAIATGTRLADLVTERLSGEMVDYQTIITVNRLLPPLDHPYDPAHCLVTGTGLTHAASATVRDHMHRREGDARPATDAMRLFRLGQERGKPKNGAVGTQPEWFYKGDGTCVVAPGQAFEIDNFSLDGSEEPEIVGLYLVGDDGTPYRIGFSLGNELSDHVMERQNYLYLAHSKLRQCSFGPELLLGPLPADVQGTSRVLRDGKVLWEKPFSSGEAHMTHTIGSLEYHHFKYRLFRRPGDVHVHFLGSATLSFADGIETRSGDVFEISAEGFGKPLRNALQTLDADPEVTIRSL